MILKIMNSIFNKDSITYTINTNNLYYINYYLIRLNEKIDFKENIIKTDEELNDFKQIVDSSKRRYFAFAWARPSPAEIPDIIRRKYPYLVVKNNYNKLSEDFLFSKAYFPKIKR